MHEAYGYNDTRLVTNRPDKKKWLQLSLALVFLILLWLALDYKLLVGQDWLSETYDNPDWRTNEGNLHTYGAWDLETHVWKTEYIMQNFPHFNWNPYWYLGMPLLKYYQAGFYVIHALFIIVTGLSAAKAALLLIILGHLFATLLTFVLCYYFSRRIGISALAAAFLLTNTFISLRSYGWEPITVVFLFLFPLGLLLFFKEPLHPLRFWLILVLGISYLAHPLIWFALCMTMGIYLLTIALKREKDPIANNTRYLWKYVFLVVLSILIGAVQFLPQMSYVQVTSGAHMGVKYLPYYQVPFNIITLKDFFFDAGNLKGPGPIIMIAVLFLIVFAVLHRKKYLIRKKQLSSFMETNQQSKSQPQLVQQPSATLTSVHQPSTRKSKKTVYNHAIVIGLASTLFIMILLYYIELYNIFPMNILSSIQYHRIIPEFIIIGAALVACLSNTLQTRKQRTFYYSTLTAFVIISCIIVYTVQAQWQTTSDITTKPEFINETVQGRISFPYTDQSLSVRNSFTLIPQVYGYYEQGITNPYTDEIFSVSSGYHDAEKTLLYLQAANVGRLYVNMQEGERDQIVRQRMNYTLTFVNTGERYAYFIIPLKDHSFAQAVDLQAVAEIQKISPGCRTLFKVRYCGSSGEEFVSNDPAEISYLRAYVHLLEKPYLPKAVILMDNPDHYTINLINATKDTAIIVKMTYDSDFQAHIKTGPSAGKKISINTIGPHFMLITPHTEGTYALTLEYHINKFTIIGSIISLFTLLCLALVFLFKPRIHVWKEFPKGDLA